MTQEQTVLSLREILSGRDSLLLGVAALSNRVFTLLSGIFPRQMEFNVTDIVAGTSDDDSHLAFSGTFAKLAPWDQVEATFHIFDMNADRHLVFYFDIPSAPSAYVFLTQYSIDLNERLAESDETAPYIPLANQVQEINFPSNFQNRRILFSSFEHTPNGINGANLPDFVTNLFAEATADPVQVGLNIPMDIIINAELGDFLEDQFGSTHDETAECRGLVYVKEETPWFKFSKPTEISKTIGEVNFSIKAIELALPLPPEVASMPEIIVKSDMSIRNMLFEIDADLDLLYRTLGITVKNLPTLRELNENVLGGELVFPHSLSSLDSLLASRLSELGIMLDLDHESVLVIFFRLTHSSLDLFSLSNHENHKVSISPTLEMQFHAPFDSENRSIDGVIQGTWLLGQIEFNTVLYFPDYEFSASMAEDQTLGIDEFLPDVGLNGLVISQLEIYGTPIDRSFQAGLGVNDVGTWKFNLANREFELEEISMGITFTEGKFDGCEIDCKLELAGAQFYISGEYDKEQGLSISGGTADDSTLNVGDLANNLMEGLSLPDKMPTLKLQNILFATTPKNGEYFLSGQTDGKWQLQLMENPKTELELQIEQFSLRKEQATSVNGTLKASLTLAWTDQETLKVNQVDVRLSADKSASEDGGWQFEGSTGQGQRIPLGKLIQELGSKFGAFQLPDALANLDILNLQLSFNTGNKDFTFSGDIKFPLEGQDQEIDVLLVIEIERQSNGTYKKHFRGKLFIGDLLFKVDFSSESGLVGQYQGHQKTDLQELVDILLPHEDFTDLPQIQLDLTDAVLFYFSDKSDKTKSVLFFALKMGGGDIDKLGELPVIGEYLANYKLSIDYLISISSGEVVNKQVRAINDKLRDGFKLSETPEDGQPAIRTGFNVLATVDLGGEPLQLSSGGNGAASAPAAGGASLRGDENSLVPAENQSPATESPVTWKTLQRSVGPLYFSRVGFQYQDAKLSFLLDASINIAVLTFSMQGLSISSPLENFKPELGLAGFGLSYRSGPLEIAGEFIRQGDEFSGAAIIKAQTFSLTAFGSYGGSGAPSMFLYALLDKELGGPAFFYVTGLAFGFGYNRDLLLPPLAGVAKFPLVEAANSAPGSQPQLKSPGGMLTKLNEQRIIPPKVGSYWIAAGVRFSSFQFIESFALLLVKFGNELEILMMGLSTLQLPKPTPSGKKANPYLYIEMQFMVSVKPKEGVFRAEAQLTDNSYLIDPGSKLSGGFAFYSWFKDIKDESGKVIINGGDFVLTVGGYHPNFKVPAHYPQRQNVAPVTINWPLPQYNLSIKGTAYFAMTPSCIMAGGTLEAIYSTELIWASFTARANFLISWKPFYYDIDLNIMVHVRATLDPPGVKEGREALQDVVNFFAEAFDTEPPKLGPITINTSLSAGLHLWGPPFAGTAHIQWEMISFDVEFGAAQIQGHQLLSWREFEEAFLPQNNQPICQVSLSGGLVQEIEDKEGNKVWVVDPETLAFTTTTFIPATKISLNGSNPLPINGSGIGFRPMGSGPVTSTHTITISRENEDSGLWIFDSRRQGVPAEIWNPVNDGKEPAPSSDLLPGRVVGVNKLRPKVREAPGDDHATPELRLLTFKFDYLKTKKLRLEGTRPILGTSTDVIPESSFTLIKTTAAEDAVSNKRKDIIAAARIAGFPLNKNLGKLDILVADVATSFQSPPMTGALGSTGTRDQKFLRARSLPTRDTPPGTRQTAVRLTALLYQYRYLSMAMQAAHVRVDETADEVPVPATAGVSASIAGGREGITANQARHIAVGGHIVKLAKGLVDQEILRRTGPRAAKMEENPTALDKHNKHNLQAGQSQVWQLTPDDPDKPLETALEISRSARQRLRIVSLDRFSRPINDEILSGGEEIQFHPIDPKTAHILVTGLPMESVPPETANTVQQTTGWHGRSTLIQMQPRVYVGERVLLRAQASQQRLAASHSGVDLIGGMTAVNQNLRVDRNGNLTSGWLRTYLRVSGGQPPQTLAVSVRHSSLAAQAHPNTMVRVTDAQGTQRDLLPAFIVRESEGELVLLYPLPGNLRIEKGNQSDDGYLMVLTESTSGWVVDGVMAIHARPGQVRAKWADYRLRESVIQTESADGQEPAQVRVVAAD